MIFYRRTKTLSLVLGFLYFLSFSICYGADCNPQDLTFDQLRDYANAAQYARASAHVYGSDPQLPQGWKQLDQFDSITLFGNEDTGFHATTYEDDNGDLVIAFEGTYDLADIGTDKDIVLNKRTTQHALALDYVAYVLMKSQQSGKKITITGHSLGGSLAQLTAAAYGLPAYTYNSAAVPTPHIDTAQDDGQNSIDKFDSWDQDRQDVFQNPLQHPAVDISNFINSEELVNSGSKLGGAENIGDDIFIDSDLRSGGRKFIDATTGAIGWADAALQFHSMDNMALYFECIEEYFTQKYGDSPTTQRPINGNPPKDSPDEDSTGGTILKKPQDIGKAGDIGTPLKIGKPKDIGKAADIGTASKTGTAESIGTAGSIGKAADIGKAPDIGKPADIGKAPGI